MPLSNKEVRDSDINLIISTSKEDLDKLSDDELMVICDVIRLRQKDDWKVKIKSIQNMFNTIHYLLTILDINEKNRKDS